MATDFLPDKDREVEEAELRQKLAKEWELRQQARLPLRPRRRCLFTTLQAWSSKQIADFKHPCTCCVTTWPQRQAQTDAAPSGYRQQVCFVSARSMLCTQIIKNEPLEITFSYWDGSGHRRKVVVKKGDSINDFLKACRDTARSCSPSTFHVCHAHSRYREGGGCGEICSCNQVRAAVESLSSVLSPHVC